MFLDANSSTPPLPKAKQALLDALEVLGNPSSPHHVGRKARAVLDQAREQVAVALGAQDKQVFFHSGASEGNRWFVDAVVRLGLEQKKPQRVLVSPLEHPSLLKPLIAASERQWVDLQWISVNSDAQLLFERTQLEQADVVFAMAANNEIGTTMAWDALLALLPDRVLLISDAAQAVGRIGPLPQRVDGIVASAHKMGGVAGSGANVIRGNAVQLKAPWQGGGQEANLRPGTEALALIAAFGAAASCVEATRKAHAGLLPLRLWIESTIQNGCPGAHIVCQKQERLPNTVAVSVLVDDPEALRMAADLSGVCVGFGSACSALALDISTGLLALGMKERQAKSTLRISLHPGLDEQNVMQATHCLTKTINQCYKRPLEEF